MEDKPIHNIDISNFKRNPYPDLKEMRASNPICFVPQVKATMICDRDSIYECEKNIDVFSSVQPQRTNDNLNGAKYDAKRWRRSFKRKKNNI